MGLRIAVQQQQRRPAAAGHQIDLGAGDVDPATLETREEFGHRGLPRHRGCRPAGYRWQAYPRAKAIGVMAGQPCRGRFVPRCGFTRRAIEASMAVPADERPAGEKWDTFTKAFSRPSATRRWSGSTTWRRPKSTSTSRSKRSTRSARSRTGWRWG